jgi:hypothetical protein
MKPRSNHKTLVAVIGNALFVVVAGLGASANAVSAPVVGYSFDFIQGTGEHDLTLTPDAISNAVLQGLRAGGIAASAAPQTADAVVHVEVVESYEPKFQSLRIVSGTISLRGPRPGASDFERPILLCQSSVQAWRTSQNSQDAAYKVRNGIMQQAAKFAQSCRSELKGL